MEEAIKPQKPAPKAAKEASSAGHETLPTTPPPAPAADPDEFVIPDEAFVDVVESDSTAHAKSTSAYDSCGWIQGPGAISLLAEASRDLLEVAALRGQNVSKIRYVKLYILKSMKLILACPSSKKVRGSLEVSWKDGTASFNASDDLLRAEVEVESGKRIRCRVHVVTKSKVGAALVIDMKAIADVKNVAKRSSASTKGKKGRTPADDDLDLDLEDEE